MGSVLIEHGRKKSNPYKYKPKQIGRGTKRHRSYVIPLRPHSQLESTVNTAHVTPVAAVEERAKAEHANDIKEGVPFVKVRDGIKRPRSQSSFISAKKRKATTRLNQRKKKNKSSKSIKQQKKKSTKKELITKNQRKPAKKTKSTKQKKLKIDAFRSVFKD